MLTGPAIPPVEASNVSVTTVLTEIIVVDGAETKISGSADALGVSGADAAGVGSGVINGLTGAVSAITSGEVVSPLAATGPANPATDAPPQFTDAKVGAGSLVELPNWIYDTTTTTTTTIKKVPSEMEALFFMNLLNI